MGRGQQAARSELTEHDLRVKIIGKFLKEKRTKAGLTQQEVALGLSYDTAQFVSNWERGISLPPLVALPKLAIKSCMGVEFVNAARYSASSSVGTEQRINLWSTSGEALRFRSKSWRASSTAAAGRAAE